jgi:hypothetical protein
VYVQIQYPSENPMAIFYCYLKKVSRNSQTKMGKPIAVRIWLIIVFLYFLLMGSSLTRKIENLESGFMDWDFGLQESFSNCKESM